MDRLRALFSSEPEEDEEVIFSDSSHFFSSLSYSSRIKGFVICFVVGVLLSILSNLFFLLPGYGIRMFALFYSIGNLCSLLSTFFLMGPVKQCKRMFAKTRLLAALFFSTFLVLTICSAIYRKAPLCLIFSILQSLALTWYSLSFIPYARTAVQSCLTSMC